MLASPYELASTSSLSDSCSFRSPEGASRIVNVPSAPLWNIVSPGGMKVCRESSLIPPPLNMLALKLLCGEGWEGVAMPTNTADLNRCAAE